MVIQEVRSMKRTFTERSLVSWSIFQGTTCSPTKFQEKVTLYAVTRIMFLRNLFERQVISLQKLQETRSQTEDLSGASWSSWTSERSLLYSDCFVWDSSCLHLTFEAFCLLSVICKQYLKQCDYSVDQSALLTGFRTDFTTSVWNICRWVPDVSPRETSPVAKSEYKRLFSQANHHIVENCQ